MGCSGNCSTCKDSSCKERKESLLVETASENNIKKIIAVASGKGGVGKSTVTSLLAVNLAQKGYKVGIIDADITGPSIPKAFGVNSQIVGNGSLMFPALTKLGIKVISVNLLIGDPSQPVLWRGPIIGGAVKQFYQDVLWEDLDYLLIDMPPGTGDVALTVFQSIPVDEVVMVTTPQDLVSLIVKKAYNMAQMMNIPVLGIVENMSYVICPDCGKSFNIFGSGSETVAEELGVPLLGKMPIDVSLAQMVDNGEFERFENEYLAEAAKAIDEYLNNK